MKLLIVTQAVDADNPVLGFFHRWIEEFAVHAERVEVICLKKGTQYLPDNVRVHSLGKEYGGASRLKYVLRFFGLAWRLRNSYDAVFVHMNQEYVLIAGLLWKLLRKRIYFWRNHRHGTVLTSFAVQVSTKVFCTSKDSYTARFAKTERMPVGIDTKRFSVHEPSERKARSILFLSRMSPVKRPELLIDALLLLKEKGIECAASFVGSPTPGDESYYEMLKVRAQPLGTSAVFLPEVPNDQTPHLYRAHDIFINTTPSGALDKTIFEAAACGSLVIAAARDFAERVDERLSFKEDTPSVLASKLETLLRLPQEQDMLLRQQLRALAKTQDTTALIGRLWEIMAG